MLTGSNHGIGCWTPTQPKKAATMSNSQQALADLAQAWTQAKTDARTANARRLGSEKRILEIEPAKEEGSSTITVENGVKIITTGKLS